MIISFICEFIAEHNYKLSGKDPTSHRLLKAVFVGVLIPGLIKRLMSSCDKLTTRKVVRFQKWRGGNGQVWWDLLIIAPSPKLQA